MSNPLFQYVVTAGDVAIVTIVLFITFSLWSGVFLYLYINRGDT